MKNYKVQLVSIGPLTQLPDSQKLFGALIYMFSEEYGGNKATALVKSVLNKEIHLALSNVMPLDYLPAPQEYLIDLLSEAVDSDADFKSKRAAIKDRHYIKPEQLKRLITEPEECESTFPYIKLQDQQQLRASIESDRYDIPELENRLYSVPTVVPQEISLDRNCKTKKAVSLFQFYLQVNDVKIGADLLDMLNAAAKVRQILILGARASQGLNSFKVSSISEPEFPGEHSHLFLNTGMLLPDEIDFASSILKLHTSERRPFEMDGGWDKNFIGQYISFIAEGSIISAPAGFKSAGKSISSPFNPRDIVLGNAFLYPMPPSGRKV